MKYVKNLFLCSSLLLLSMSLVSCLSETPPKKQDSAMVQELDAVAPTRPVQPASLPVIYQTANYVVDKEENDDISLAAESTLKVGANISSTRGPQPLWDILKRLASLKNMNVSWASDVDRNVLVDVNIGANDDFYTALDNMLRQVDYYHEMQGSTIIVKYKETRQFHVAMPFIKQTYKTRTGGDVLGGGDGAANSNVAGEISLSTEGVEISNLKDGTPGGIEFNIWNSIENNLNAILDIWTTDAGEDAVLAETAQTALSGEAAQSGTINDSRAATLAERAVAATFRRSTGGNSYFIDKPVGLITVTAPRPLLEKLETYFKSLKKELYKQVAIEAKILEVQLDDSSSIGLNWNLILRNLSAAGSLTGGKTYSKSDTDNVNSSTTDSNTLTITDGSTRTRDRTYDYTTEDDPATTLNESITVDEAVTGTSRVLENVASSAVTSGLSAATVITNGVTGSLGGLVSLAAFSFDSFLNAVSAQGQATILSNPKLAVLNGQPALITVGRNVTYISDITSDVSDSGVITYSAETARALSGIGLALTANILDDSEIILNLVPVTSELVEPIEYRAVGLGSVGLPIISVREISTTVKVKNGEMLVIGGLISSTDDSEDSFVPGTRNIPFFKYLFGYEEKTKSKRELIILLKPRII